MSSVSSNSFSKEGEQPEQPCYYCMMPDRDQELRCVRLILPTLNDRFGGDWVYYPGVAPDENPEWQHIKTPDFGIANGRLTAAVEVKRLVGDPAYREHEKNHIYLYKWLVPSYRGRYYLYPCGGFRLPMSLSFRRRVKAEIERVGKELPPKGEGVIRIPRTGAIECVSEQGGPFVNCYHPGQDQTVREITPYVTGIYCLRDESRKPGWEHSFKTNSARYEFQERLIDGCYRATVGQPVDLTWYEEWTLVRSGTSTEDGVTVTSIWGGRVEVGLLQELQEALDKAGAKFATRWADIHVIVVERLGPSFATAEDIAFVIPRLRFPPNVHLILLVDGDKVTEIPNSAAPRLETAPDDRQNQRSSQEMDRDSGP